MADISEIRFPLVELRTPKGLEFTVRDCSESDFEALVSMYKGFRPKRVAQGLPPPDVPRIAHWLDRLRAKSRCLLALKGKRVVGHTILCPISDSAAEFAVFIHQDYRRLGLGSALSRLALALVEKAGFSEVVLATQLSNRAALALYQKLGFRVTSAAAGECEMKLEIARAGSAESAAA